MKEFEGQWAVILGGSSGLGLASAKKLASHGMNICIVHRDRKLNLDRFENDVAQMKSFGIEIKTFNQNALNKDVQKQIVDEFNQKQVRLLLHSIAKGSLKKMTGNKEEILSKEDLDITIHAMATSWYEWASRFYQNGLFAAKARNIAFTSEGNSKVWAGYGAVSVAKVALQALMQNMAAEWASTGVTSNCIQAGTTETASFSVIPNSEYLAKMALERNPFNRLTTPEDVANAVYLLCKKEADWINGTIITVDGGESLR